MKVTSCLLVKLDARSREIAANAIRSVFPEAEITVHPTLEGASDSPEPSRLELLLLGDPDSSTLERAGAMMDSSGLQRWGILVHGEVPSSSGFVNAVPPDEWNEAGVIRALLGAAAFHALIRENGQLRGDLLTIGSRVSHDMRAPLGAIINAGEILKDIALQANADSGAFSKPLFDSVDDLGKIVARVSQFTRACSGTAKRQVVPIQEVIWSVLQRHERQILEQRAVVSQPGRWPDVTGVASWLEVVWVNLVGNALKHGAKGVHIELGWTQQDREFLFWVNDNGSGIPADRVRNLFQPFNLLHRLDARKGLGLSIVRRLVELQNGKCGYSPRESGGSSFHFTLPDLKKSSRTSSSGRTCKFSPDRKRSLTKP